VLVSIWEAYSGQYSSSCTLAAVLFPAVLIPKAASTDVFGLFDYSTKICRVRELHRDLILQCIRPQAQEVGSPKLALLRQLISLGVQSVAEIKVCLEFTTDFVQFGVIAVARSSERHLKARDHALRESGVRLVSRGSLF
jgi:hypothetical protein